MKKTMKLFGLAVMAIGVLLTSCGKDGDDGLDGVTGPQGEQGAPGEDGTNGLDGNAEVLYSDWIPANFTGTSTSVKYMGIDFPNNLPSAFSIKSTHVVLVYYSGWGDGNSYLLPVLNFRGAQFTFGFGSGSAASSDINVRAQSLSGDLNEFQIDPARGAKLRYVIIPPSVNISGKSLKRTIPEQLKDAGVDTNDYNQVAAFFNID